MRVSSNFCIINIIFFLPVADDGSLTNKCSIPLFKWLINKSGVWWSISAGIWWDANKSALACWAVCCRESVSVLWSCTELDVDLFLRCLCWDELKAATDSEPVNWWTETKFATNWAKYTPGLHTYTDLKRNNHFPLLISSRGLQPSLNLIYYERYEFSRGTVRKNASAWLEPCSFFLLHPSRILF